MQSLNATKTEYNFHIQTECNHILLGYIMSMVIHHLHWKPALSQSADANLLKI